MNERLNNTEILRDRKVETISSIAIFSIFLFISAYILYVWENRYRSQFYVKEKGFSTIVAQQFDGPSGEHQHLKQYAQQLLVSPHTYRHIETIYIHNDSHQELFVRTLFSGHTTRHTEEILCLKATYSSQGNIIKEPARC
ncbi:hypothetical protein [Wohlfahrtiimonas larvae]|uniref:Uncharacterized protein n=1 Tax=Wohlfahrtiimonas larvae TaxID=1157986 RepID=A0ABP9MQZ2_9GAMM|nr:hypothetical protein [Wohlfahrtiimonas larvae]